LALQKYDPLQPDTGLVKALFYSRLPIARETAIKWVEAKTLIHFLKTVNSLLPCCFALTAEVRKWVSEKMSARNYTPTQAELICGRVITIGVNNKTK
jgi:hypothetical protein